MEKDWEKLTQHERQEYERKAQFLLDRGYVENVTVEEIAKKIYEKKG